MSMHTGGSNPLTARCARALTNHAPTGEYRVRFFPAEATFCHVCHILQDRNHILYRCTLYKRPTCFRHSLARSKLFILELINFLTTNPTSFTFEDADRNLHEHEVLPHGPPPPEPVPDKPPYTPPPSASSPSTTPVSRLTH